MKIITYQADGGCIDDRFNDALSALCATAASPLAIEVERADPDLEVAIANWNGGSSLVHILLDHFNDDLTSIRLLISSGRDQTFRTYCLNQVPHANWGCCIADRIAIEYAPERYRFVTQLHETLHLFGVDDCYEAKTQEPKASCSDAECFMRYGILSTKVCPNVLNQLRS